MQPKIRDIILAISEDVVNNLSSSFEKIYYGKMNYSSKNNVLDSDKKLLRKTIGFEIAFVHTIAYFLVCNISDSIDYTHMLSVLDTDKLFSWYQIANDDIISQLSKCKLSSQNDIYELINEHDKFIDKDVKKKMGQFYTPTGIAKKMVSEVKTDLKALSEQDLIVRNCETNEWFFFV